MQTLPWYFDSQLPPPVILREYSWRWPEPSPVRFALLQSKQSSRRPSCHLFGCISKPPPSYELTRLTRSQLPAFFLRSSAFHLPEGQAALSQQLWWWCRPHPVREHAQDLRPPLGARPASPPTRQAAQPPPRSSSTNHRPLV